MTTADGRPSISQDELAARLALVQEKMAAQGVSLAVISSALNVHYLTGIDLGGYITPQALILDDRGDHRFVCRATEMTWHGYWSERSWCTDWVGYTDAQDPYDAIIDVIAQIGSGRELVLALELERASMPWAVAERISGALKPIRTVVAGALVEPQRIRKSAGEIAMMRRAGEITKAGVLAEADAVRSGATDHEAVTAAVGAMLAEGTELFSDMPYLPVGPESARAHGHWNHRTPRAGDPVTFMMSASYQRYQCPIERTYIYKGGNSAAQRLIDAALKVQETVQATLRPGMTSGEADALARGIYEDEGCARWMLNRLAYSIGIAYPPVWWENELMQLRPNDERVLEPGMTFHVVPCLYVDGVGFLNRSMPTLITETGAEPLIDLPLRVDLL